MKVILQHDERDCGAACLSMIAAHYGRRLPISRCRELTKIDKSGTNLYGLVSGAERLSLKAEALSGTPEELTAGLAAGELRFPLVAHIISQDGMLHYVVVYGQKNGRLLLADPGKGKRRVKREDFFACWTGYIVTFAKTEEFHRGNEVKGSFTKFFALLKGQYRKLAAILLLSLLASIIGMLGAFVFQLVLDDFTTPADEQAIVEEMEHADTHEDENLLERTLEYVAGRMDGVHVVFISLIGLYLLQAGIQLARGWLIIQLSKRIDLKLTLSYYYHIMGMPAASVAVRQTGEYLSRFSDTAIIRHAISTATVTLLMDTLMAAACGVILYAQCRRLFDISLLMVLLYAVVVLIFRKPIERSNRRAMERDAGLQSYFKESIDGVETIKAACAERQVKAKTEKKFGAFLDAVVKSSLIGISQEVLVGTIELVGTVLILWTGFSMALAGQITVGSVITFYALLAYFTEPIKNLIGLQPVLQTAFVAADRLNDILELKSEGTTGGESVGRVEEWAFRHVDFRYGNRELTLHDISLTIRRGEKVAIVGESGSGKTTLAKLLMRFYEPERGSILLDGRDIGRFELSALRGSIAYVEQSTFFFSDTIRSNLTLGNEQVTEEAIQRVCRISRAAEFVGRLPMGLETPLDERGMDLSGGQRQRLAIARALLRKPQLLILDEATSHLDTITEGGVRQTVFQLEEMTCLLIAHRLTTAKDCDRIYVMAEGRIIEEGTHEELLRRNGRYRQMWEAQ